MSTTSSPPFLLTNMVLNRVLIPLLRSRAGARLGRSLAIVEYDGRRTGRPHRLVTQYTRSAQTVRITVGAAHSKTWWRNFTTDQPLRLHLAGNPHRALAHVERRGEHTELVAEIETPLGGSVHA